MCSDGRANRSPNDAEVGNLICLEASSVMAWHGLQESAGNEAFSHSTWWVIVSDCLEGNYVGGASVECVFSAGVEGIPSDKPRLYFLTGERKVGTWSMCGREDV